MTRPAIDSRQYIVALELRSTDDCPPDFELPATLAGFDTGLFLPRDDPDWFGRSAYPPRILLLKGGALHIVTHPSAGEPAHRWTLERISSVESGHMLLRGWLRFTGSGFDFTLRYNTRGFPSVFQFMRRFRSEFLHGTPCGDPAVNPRTALDIKFGNALERELDSAETVVTQAFQKLVVSTPPEARRRFAGADRPAAVVDYGPGAGIPVAIWDYRFVCSPGRGVRRRSHVKRRRPDYPGGPEGWRRVADSDLLRMPASRGRVCGGARDSEEAQ
jgi:hypothetical protein